MNERLAITTMSDRNWEFSYAGQFTTTAIVYFWVQESDIMAGVGSGGIRYDTLLA